MRHDIQTLKAKYNEMQRDYLSRKGRRDQLIEDKGKIQARILEIEETSLLKEKTAELLRKLGTRAREQTKENLESMITNALQFVFQEDMTFKIVYDEKRGRPEAQFLVVSTFNGTVIDVDPKEAHGGGIVDVASITLRIALAELFGIKGPLIMDEPSKHLSEQFVQNFAVFLRQISEQFGRQIIMITHKQTLAEFADMSYLVTQTDGVSKVERIV